jgi:DNA-binding NarL/FixJ family response regulator
LDRGDDMSAIRVSIADDSESMRMVYKRVLETQDEFEVVGMAADGEQALKQATDLAPDVAILDIVMPIMNGIDVALRIADRHPSTGIVMISSYEDPVYVSAIMKGGEKRRAYILKSSLAEISELIRVVEAVANNQIVLDSRITRRLLRHHSQQAGALPGSLDAMEEDVLQLLLEGRDVAFIADALGQQPGEIEANAASAYAKLGVIEENSGDKVSSAVQTLVSQAS